MKCTFLLRITVLFLCIFVLTMVSSAQNRDAELADVKGKFKEMLLDSNLFTKLANSHISFEGESGKPEKVSFVQFLGGENNLKKYLDRMGGYSLFWDSSTVSFGFNDPTVSARNNIKVIGDDGLLHAHLSVSSEGGLRILVIPLLRNVFKRDRFETSIASSLASAFEVKEPTENLNDLLKKLGNIDNGKRLAARLTVHGEPVLGEDGKPVTLAALLGEGVKGFLTMISNGKVDWEDSALSFGLGDGQAVMGLSIMVRDKDGYRAGRLMISPETAYKVVIVPNMDSIDVRSLLNKGIVRLLTRAIELPKADEIQYVSQLQTALKNRGDSISNVLDKLSGVELQSDVTENGKITTKSVTLLEFFGGRQNVATWLEGSDNGQDGRIFLIVR